MPRLVNSVPRYRKHRATGQAIVSINGRDYYLGLHGTKASRLEYDRIITEWLSSGRSTAFGALKQQLTIVELIVAYVHHARQYYGQSANSELHRIVRVVRPLKKFYGRTPAVDFGVLEFKAVRQTFLDEDCSRSFVNASMRRVTRMFRWAASEGLVPASVPQTLAIVPGLRRGKTTARETARVLPADDALVDATLPFLPEVIADMARFQRLTGCRPAEVCSLRPADIDRTGDVWEFRPRSHKTEHHGHTRVIFIGPQAQGVLLRYLARDSEAHCFRPCDSEAKRRAAVHASRRTSLSCGNKPGTNRKAKPQRGPGECYNPRSYHQAVRAACIKAFAVPAEIADDAEAVKAWRQAHRWAPNQLRHSAATMIRKRFGLEAAQVVLGHSRANVTEIYAERNLGLAANVALEVG